MSLLWSCTWAWSLSLLPQPPGDSDSTPPLRLRLQRLNTVPFLMATDCYDIFGRGLEDDLMLMYRFWLLSERNTTLSTSGDEENIILLDVPSPPFSDSEVLDSMHPIMSGNRVWSGLPVVWRRVLLRQIASALVEVISPLRNTSAAVELVITEEMFRMNNLLVAQESFDIAQHNVVARPVPNILLDSLVTEVYSGNDAEEKCVICKEEYVGGTEIIRLPCSHCFHGHCITPWFQERDTCPICRYRLHI